ncbi:diguanylate phosphodiesterase [Clostridia bacterium]|nr:diguanylate phosphodiesterase [Clostridia bacterium]
MKKSLGLLLALLIGLNGLFGMPVLAETAVKDSVTIGLNVSLASLEPMSAFSREEQYVIANTFDTLIELEDGVYVGELAKSFEISEDMLTYTFVLNENVYFHNGEHLTASDVKYTFDNLASFSFWEGNAHYIASVETEGDYTVVIHATNPTAYNMVVLSGTEIINEKAITELGEAHRFAPVGTGPYRVVSYDGFNTIKLERNDDYFKWTDGNYPPIQYVTYKVFSDPQAMSLALEAGELDLVSKVDAAYALPFEEKSGYTVYWLDADGVYLLLFNCGLAPFDNKLVRQAVAYGVDRESINLIVSEGKDLPWDYFYSPAQAGAPDYDTLPHFTYDLEKAKALLAEAGYPNGIKLEQAVPIMNTQERYAVAIQQQLAQIGIDFDIEILEQNTLYDKIFAMDYQLLTFSLSTEIYEMSYVAKYFYTPAKKARLFPTGEFGTPELDELIAKGEATSDMATRVDLYTQIYTTLFDEQPLTAIMSKQTSIIKKDNLTYSTPNILKVKIERLAWE